MKSETTKKIFSFLFYANIVSAVGNAICYYLLGFSVSAAAAIISLFGAYICLPSREEKEETPE